MFARSEPEPTAPSSPPAHAEPRRAPPRASGLLTARIYSASDPLAAVTLVAELDDATIRRLRQEALAMRARHAPPITIEACYVCDPAAADLLATLDDLAPQGIRVVATPVGTGATDVTVPASPRSLRTEPPAPCAASAETPARRQDTDDGARVPSADPFGLDHGFRTSWLAPLRFLFERYWRIEVSGMEHVPARGPVLIAANHSGAVPADAFMLGVALELRHPERRCLRVLYDKFVDALPFVGPLYNRLGGVSASFANAELLLRRGELVGLFPEGVPALEKRWTERYRLRPFKSGTARLSVRTGSPIVPVAIVGAEEAYPVVARLYRAGRVVGLPWIPLTPLFPLCGLAGALPLPTKWHMRFCAPIEPPALNGRSEEDAVSELTGRLRDTIATALGDLLAKRRSIFV
jgi:1-acyl-sn-glycerol-3-phosphate acyltransferase